MNHALAVTLAALLAAAPPAAAQVAHPDRWPAAASPPRAADVEARIGALLAAMPVEDKVAQLIQVDIASIKPGDIADVRVGSVLNGGNSSPHDDERAPPKDWLALADAFWRASVAPRPGHPTIPLIWGTDAVHGDNNIVGATLFPHNIGLGAARDRDLIRRIGAATAAETAATGLDWSFAPTLAVVQDDRWGRTYESYSEDPAVVASYAGAMVEGVQGTGGDFMVPGHVIATAKHFLGDGGTGGRDQGDTRVGEDVLAGVHAAGYPPAIRAGVLTVMASFSSWNGAKMHGNASLLTDVLKGRMGFDGLVVGDWNAHAQVPGCTVDHCAAAITAGLDMFMVSGDWRALYRNTLADVRSGAIPAARLDDAVRRILRVKALAGALDAGLPSARPAAGRFGQLGSPEHRALAREAVRKSLVLLKNDGVLPLAPHANILVAGRGADSIAQQSGGWTITWQGTDVTNADVPNGESIWHGIAAAVAAASGHATLSLDGSFTAKPDVAIVVFGEMPYAEMVGDRPTLDYSPADRSDLALLRRLKAAGVPVVAVFLSGRPLWVNAEINASDAFVAAFLPGSEGGGVADLLFRRPDGGIAHDFTGRLSFSWPRRPDQFVLNRRDPGYDPLFALGYGLSYAHPGSVPVLDEARPAGAPPASFDAIFARGTFAPGWTARLAEPATGTPLTARARTAHGWLAAAPIDRRAQEDARRLTWSGGGAAVFTLSPPQPIDLSREANAQLSLVAELRVESGDPVLALTVTGGARTATITLKAMAPGEWRTVAVPLDCFKAADLGAVTVLGLGGASAGTVSVSDLRIASTTPTVQCPR